MRITDDSCPERRHFARLTIKFLVKRMSTRNKNVSKGSPSWNRSAIGIARLQKLFRFYNQRYWNGVLPPCRVRRHLRRGIRALLPKGQIGSCVQSDRLIWIHPKLRGLELRCTLLHEMCHLATPYRGHGPTFYEQVCRGPEYFIWDECLTESSFVKSVFKCDGPPSPVSPGAKD
jgi:hypothetical protein